MLDRTYVRTSIAPIHPFYDPPIETERLTLVACPAETLRVLLTDPGRAQELLGATVPEGWPDAELTDILPACLARLEADPTSLGDGVWVIVAREPRTVVGSAGFLGPPDQDGAMELGYGIHPPHRGAGYATEAAAALVRWALARPGVSRVVARCADTNAASIRVLEKIGMRRTGADEGMIAWAAEPVSAA
jgi:ribosomal-protein-alanine N-acetyltransferase